MTETVTGDYVQTVIKRNGNVVVFDRDKIFEAISAAYREELEVDSLPIVAALRVDAITEAVQAAVEGTPDLSVEDIQDVVEREIDNAGDFSVAKRYILYREEQRRKRDYLEHVTLETALDYAEHILGDITTNIVDFLEAVKRQCQPSATYVDVLEAMIYECRARVETDPQYHYAAARGMLQKNRLDVSYLCGTAYPSLADVIQLGITVNLYDSRMKSRFDLARLQDTLVPERDNLFKFQGIQILYDRYFSRIGDRRLETPQVFWMRVAMGLALEEKSPTERAIEFYHVMSTFRMSPSTPTLFYSGTPRSQMASCFLLTQEDSLDSIMDTVNDSAHLAKWAGGLGIDYTNIRAVNSHIDGVNGKSSGVIPFINIMNAVVGSIQQGGRRRSSAAIYLEPWHLEIEEFLDLRKNVGDERRRTADLNTALWIPDLFMERVQADGDWWLFDPKDVPDLHEKYGLAFKAAYEFYEAQAATGRFPLARRVKAVDLWRSALSSLYETGHPWITFKDPSNLRSPQRHVGVVHSSNLCTEITLNTSKDEIAVCNLASINLDTHTKQGVMDENMMEETIKTAIRMLDNVIDLNFYPVVEAENSNKRHRPIGLGIMGFQDALWNLGVSYASDKAIQFADESMEFISYHAIRSSSNLAEERGSYSTYEGSYWSYGMSPISTIQNMGYRTLHQDRKSSLPWYGIGEQIRERGMRNSLVCAIAPTATISNIQGVTQSIEPLFSNIFAKKNMSGTFTVVNERLVQDLQDLNLWDADMLNELKVWDGSIAYIDRIPDNIKEKYPTAFEIHYSWLIEAASRRQKWIDQSQSLNLYIVDPSGRQLSEMYMKAWEMGLKTTYYLRSRGATNAEKSTVSSSRFGMASAWDRPAPKIGIMETANRSIVREAGVEPKYVTGVDPLVAQVSIDDFEDMICESCQ